MKKCFVVVVVLVAQTWLTLHNPRDYSPPGSSVHGILQARILEWVAIPFSRGSSWPSDWTWVSCITGRFFAIWATREGESNTLSVNKSRASVDRGAWQATVRTVAKSCTQLKRLSTARNRQWKSSCHLLCVLQKVPWGKRLFSFQYWQYRQVNRAVQLCDLLFMLTQLESKKRMLVTLGTSFLLYSTGSRSTQTVP